MTPEEEIEWALNAPPRCEKCRQHHDDQIPAPKPSKECGCSIDWDCGGFTNHGVKTYREDACYRQQAPFWVDNAWESGGRPLYDVIHKLLDYARELRLLQGLDR